MSDSTTPDFHSRLVQTLAGASAGAMGATGAAGAVGTGTGTMGAETGAAGRDSRRAASSRKFMFCHLPDLPSGLNQNHFYSYKITLASAAHTHTTLNDCHTDTAPQKPVAAPEHADSKTYSAPVRGIEILKHALQMIIRPPVLTLLKSDTFCAH